MDRAWCHQPRDQVKPVEYVILPPLQGSDGADPEAKPDRPVRSDQRKSRFGLQGVIVEKCSKGSVPPVGDTFTVLWRRISLTEPRRRFSLVPAYGPMPSAPRAKVASILSHRNLAELFAKNGGWMRQVLSFSRCCRQ